MIPIRQSQIVTSTSATIAVVHPPGRIVGILMNLYARLPQGATANALCAAYLYRGPTTTTADLLPNNTLAQLSALLQCEAAAPDSKALAIWCPIDFKVNVADPISLYVSAGTGATCGSDVVVFFEGN